MKGNLVTNVVFTAKITDAQDNELKLVNFRGLFFKEEQFMKYVLYRLNNSGDLNYYKQVEATSTEHEGIVENNWKYVQVGPADFDIARPDADKKDAHMTLKLKDGINLYAYDENAEAGNKFTLLTNGANDLNTSIDNLLTNGSDYPEYYNGYTTYCKPIQHLLGKDNTNAVVKDGEYGVVRNHWYNFTVDKIMNMGDGVFNPGDGDDSDIIIPDPEPKQKFALAAKINILSWKIVTQKFDL